MKSISILGSTGSIGTQTLEIISAFPDRFRVKGLSAGRNMTLLKEQIALFNPELVCVTCSEDAKILNQEFPSLEVFYGEMGLDTLATTACDLLVVAIYGTTAIRPCYKAISNGQAIGLACKEILVSAGDLMMAKAKACGATILPIDSEHAALHQCLHERDMDSVEMITLTASGGPFWEYPLDRFSSIRKEDALKHPNWSMGSKITIDSATMVNKGLEIIEAHHLFGLEYDQMTAMIHPQSIVHAVASFCDGNVIAQLALPDMRIPIQYALSYPEKIVAPWPRLSLIDTPDLSFHEMCYKRFPLFRKALEAGQEGGLMPAIFNAANEKAVLSFLDDKISFLEIEKSIDSALNKFSQQSSPTIDEIIHIDGEVKHYVSTVSTQ